MGQQSSSGRVGRHRQERLHRHRAPAFPALFATRGRAALSVTALGATLAAGVGAAGVAASAAPSALAANPAAHVTASHPYAELPIVAPSGDDAPAKQFRDAAPGAESAGPTGAAVQRKQRPVVVAKVTAAVKATAVEQWVNPMPSGGVTSCFGQRWGRLHAGVDLAAPHGTPIVAAGAGVVVAAGPAGGYGNAVLIQHDNGYLTHYGHMSAILVAVGQKVTAGEQIGQEGSTGHSTGPHLHFEVHEDHYKNPVEPTAWMRAHGVELGGCSPTAEHDHEH